MAALNPAMVNEELKKAREKHMKAQISQLRTELDKKLAFENARATASSKTVDGKVPSEAACERAAKNDGTYLKLCEKEIEAINETIKADIEVEFLRKSFDIALKT